MVEKQKIEIMKTRSRNVTKKQHGNDAPLSTSIYQQHSFIYNIYI